MIDIQRLIVAGLAAGAWIVTGGLLMAAAFGYREMKTAFGAVGLAIPAGLRPFVLHTAVRMVTGLALVTLYALLLGVLHPTTAMLAAAGFAWLLGALLPFAVIVEWGLFPWSLAAKLWLWDAGELLIAAAIGRFLYHP